MSIDYSIIIPAYNEEELLPATLRRVGEAMEHVAGFQGEVIVVDNASTDATAAVARQGGATVVSELHRQIARARNAGAAASRGRFLVFLDADTLLSDELLQQTLATLAAGQAVGGGVLPVFEGERYGRVVRGSVALWYWLSRTFRWAAGAYVFCRREAFEAVGGFDERFYASEEVHLSRALKRWGRRHGQAMVIFPEGLVTSARKLRWFTPGQLLGTALLILLWPRRLRSRAGCRFWYDRPR